MPLSRSASPVKICAFVSGVGVVQDANSVGVRDYLHWPSGGSAMRVKLGFVGKKRLLAVWAYAERIAGLPPWDKSREMRWGWMWGGA